jgi:TatD DNase family protein
MSNDILWIDSHAHLTMFDRDEVPEILDRAMGNGVAGVLTPATGGEDLERAVEAASLDDGLKRRIERACEAKGVVAVGEIGLDYHYMNSPREDQIEALVWQLDFALEIDRPVILHNRESWMDLEPLLADRRGRLRGVCHSFTEGPAADNIREMVGAVEPERLLVETDSPFLAPAPHRGKRNEPAFVPFVGKRVAQELEKTEVEIATLSTSGFKELFGVGEEWPG